MVVIAAAAALKLAGANLLVTAVVLAAAAYVDATYVAPRFMDEPEDSPSLGGWDVTYAEEGSPMKWAYGPTNRLPGQIIQAGRPWETQSGGGGGKRAEPVSYTFWTDVIFAITANQMYRVDRIDIEGNTSYLRDVTTQVETSWALSLLRFEYFFDDQQTTVVWQRTGAVGSSTEWSLVQWHVTLTNISPYEFESLGHFMPGEMLRVEGYETGPVPGFTQSSSWSATSTGYSRVVPGQAVFPMYTRLDKAWLCTCISSRNHGYETVVNALGEEVTLARTKLVFDILGTKGQSGIWRHRLHYLQSTGVYNSNGGMPYFFEGVSTAERDNFRPNTLNNPFNYLNGSSTYGWPRNLGVSTQRIKITYDDPRNWALDVLRNNNPVAGVDYFEHIGNTQTFIDPIYEQQVGSNNTPALPQLSYFSMASLNISRFGNRIPQMHFYIDASERYYNTGTQTVDVRPLEAVSDNAATTGAINVLLVRHGNIKDTQFDATSMVTTQTTIQGMSFGGLHEVQQLVSAVCMLADLTPQEHSSKLHFFSRDQRPVVNASWRVLDAKQWNAPPSPMLEIEDQDMRKLPKRIHLRFSDVDKDMQPGDVYAYRDALSGRWTQTPTGDTNEADTRRIQIPNLVVSHEQARPIAERVLTDIQRMRQRVRLRLPSWYMLVTEGDVIKIGDYWLTSGHRDQTNPLTGATRYQDRDWWIVVDQVDIGADYFIEVEGILWPDDPRSFTVEPATAQVGAGYFTGGTEDDEAPRSRDYEIKDKLQYNPPSIVLPLDIPPIKDEHAGKTGMYFAYCAPGAHRSQPSGSLYEDIGDGDAWVDIGAANNSAVMGTVIGKLDSGPVNVETTTQSVHVNLLATDYGSGGLSSTDDDGLARGYNLAAIGSPGAWELIQFKTAIERTSTSYAGQVYEISGLRRGLRGSERYVNSHIDGEWFVLLDHRRLHFHQFDNQLVGLTRRYKVGHSTVSASPDCVVTVEGWTTRSLPVASLVAWRKSNGDVVFTWKRRTRARYRTFGTQEAPLMETTESYDVVIDLSSDRTINVSSATATYTAAMQIEDSTSGAEITATIYQRDSVRGRGQPAEVIVAQTQAEVGTEDGNVLGTEDTHTLNTPLGGGMD